MSDKLTLFTLELGLSLHTATQQHLLANAQQTLDCHSHTRSLGAGASPFFMSERAMKKLKGRKTKVATYNLDMNLVGDYWGWYGKRWYHHTGPISTW